MKIKLCFFSLLLVSFAFSSCKKSDFRYQSDFEKSYGEWMSFKGTSGNSYRYQVSGGSWTGIGWQTIITVRDRKIVQRDFKYLIPGGWQGNIPEDQKEWTENEDEIGSHTSAAEALTLDQVYEKAHTEWLKKRSNAKTYFEAKNNGLISSCGYIEDGCQDDCFIGISISFIESL